MTRTEDEDALRAKGYALSQEQPRHATFAYGYQVGYRIAFADGYVIGRREALANEDAKQTNKLGFGKPGESVTLTREMFREAMKNANALVSVAMLEAMLFGLATEGEES